MLIIDYHLYDTENPLSTFPSHYCFLKNIKSIPIPYKTIAKCDKCMLLSFQLLPVLWNIRAQMSRILWHSFFNFPEASMTSSYSHQIASWCSLKRKGCNFASVPSNRVLSVSTRYLYAVSTWGQKTLPRRVYVAHRSHCTIIWNLVCCIYSEREHKLFGRDQRNGHWLTI